jgi:hypothetical protein
MVKRILKKLILKLISKIESREFRNLDLDQKDPLKKIIDVQKLEDFFVLSDTGYVQAVELNITQPYDVWFLETSDGFSLDCADNHILFDDNYNEIFVKDLKVGDKIITTKGVSRISYLENTGIPVSMVDLSIDHPNHRYYTNDILSHNTITSSIFLLWYLLFNFEKNVMIMANIGDTAAELMDKIKVIMKGLPFFLKPGILIYNVMTMKLDNGCRIMAKTTTKTSSIGYTIHMLYMDEFAHINPNFINGFFKSVYPTISSSLISRVIITSTPNGMNKFWEIYKGAIDGENEFNPIRVEWWQVPGRDEEWKKKEIATLGSEEDFNQEYGCQFLSSSRLLLDSQTLKRLKTNEEDFTFRELSPFDSSPLDYSNLIWHPKFDPCSIFEKDNQKFYVVVDTAGGGGGSGDYSVVNIFKVSPMPSSIIKSKKFFEDESDFFCLLQIGIFRSNTIQIDELKVFMEILIAHVLGSENTRIVVEVDYKGEMLMDKLLDCEDFYDEMFVYTKHSEASTKLKPGVKLTVRNKEKFCYDLKVNTRSYKIIPSEKNTIHELTNFGMNNNGSFTSQIGKDDIAMTLVDVNCIFENGDFQEIVSDLYDLLPEKFKKMIEERLSESSDSAPSKQGEISNYTFLNGLLDS